MVTGSVEENYATFFEKITSLNGKHGPFDVLLCTGNFFSKETSDSDINDLLLGKVKGKKIDQYYFYNMHIYVYLHCFDTSIYINIYTYF